nr:YhbY family RNA-binding protein [Candidatus Njordarchaeum guaymaensis]
MIRPGIKARIKREMSLEKPTIWIGSDGVTDRLVKEVLKQLEKNEIVKVRMLRSALKGEDAKKIVQKVVQETESSLIDQRGHVFVLYKLRKRKKRHEAQKPSDAR